MIVTGKLDIPFPVAIIVAEPVATAVATPSLLIVITLALLLVQVTTTSLTTEPSDACAVAENRCEPPTSKVADVGLTVILATEGGVTVTG